ncbi:hypothetical protein [Corynebacterium lowii]|uniref:Uncharacterized protein n=1 Tax=Corynebacterium lowii TaxID=1544413 RepID=A0A0N8W086_9CORY|nr:hypothetical protein [Corynebacterium lowii]KQB86002.1 hypothetical protein Clow_01744 [Corynebacterium lowii]MDP9850568.1 hypothetical protein [Corynebacterium lowii]
MTDKNQKGLYITAGVVVLVILVSTFLVGSQNYFNRQEVKMLVDEASKHGHSWEVTIHNELTHSYSFKTIE